MIDNLLLYLYPHPRQLLLGSGFMLHSNSYVHVVVHCSTSGIPAVVRYSNGYVHVAVSLGERERKTS